MTLPTDKSAIQILLISNGAQTLCIDPGPLDLGHALSLLTNN